MNQLNNYFPEVSSLITTSTGLPNSSEADLNVNITEILEESSVHIPPGSLSSRNISIGEASDSLLNGGLISSPKYLDIKNYDDGVVFKRTTDLRKGQCGGILEYPDGSIYEGEFKEGKRHGKGTLTFRGFTHKGFFRNGKRHGEGAIVYTDGGFYKGPIGSVEETYKEFSKHANGAKFKGCFEGLFVDDKPAFGVMKYPSGFTYKGSLDKNKKPDGFGKMMYADNTIYVGCFKNGRKSGWMGAHIFADGSAFLGKFENNKFTGSSKRSIASDDWGMVIQGQGKSFESAIKYSDGSIYFGPSKGGKADGLGFKVFADGSLYKGGFIEGTRDGWGAMIYPNGNEYRGAFRRDKRNGGGILLTPRCSYVGSFKNDMLNGQVTITIGNDILYDGPFKNGLVDGLGIGFIKGSYQRCIFEKGKLLNIIEKVERF